MENYLPEKKFNPYGSKGITITGNKEFQELMKKQRKPCNRCKRVKTCNRKVRRKCQVFLKWQSS